MLFRFNRLTLLVNIVSLQFTEMSEYQSSSSYRASKSRFFPYIHCKFCRVCPTTKMTSATMKPSIHNIGGATLDYFYFLYFILFIFLNNNKAWKTGAIKLSKLFKQKLQGHRHAVSWLAHSGGKESCNCTLKKIEKNN